jgi:hypothetical protein
VSPLDTRQSIFLFFFFSLTKLFVECSYTMYTYTYHFGTIIKVFPITIVFSSFDGFFLNNLDLTASHSKLGKPHMKK